MMKQQRIIRLLKIIFAAASFALVSAVSVQAEAGDVPTAMAQCQSWIDGESTFEKDQDWTLLATEPTRGGENAVFLNRHVQMHIVISDYTLTMPEGSGLEEARVRMCNLYPLRTTGATDEVLIWGFETADGVALTELQGKWDGVERVAPSTAIGAVQELAARYEADADYVTLNPPSVQGVRSAIYGRCLDDAAERVEMTYSDGTATATSGVFLSIKRADPVPAGPPDFYQLCLSG